MCIYVCLLASIQYILRQGYFKPMSAVCHTVGSSVTLTVIVIIKTQAIIGSHNLSKNAIIRIVLYGIDGLVGVWI